ncbi:hypothetical protein [Sphingopyxis sp. MC1]|jgi:hypothetical protein|uniref:hypothetical protein n=1 Tax=Sphingopyxis sp. MC1 TaxID=1174684 RepID=UPI0002D1C85A|nr:hypothetical protein [Sphingopyxis sp. MC1]ENY80500.1 hypothetical protein EBMC1_14083 [Sphingopyxis sp. MC1]
MMRDRTYLRGVAAIAALLLAGTATGAQAQWSQDSGSGSGSGASDAAPASGAASGESDRKGGKRAEKQKKRRQVDVSPYLEIGQVLTAELKNGSDVLTYTTVAAGVDAVIATRRAEAAATIRYEHRFGESGGLGDADLLSGLARARLELMQGFNIEGGALATRARADGRGADSGLFIGGANNVANLYSIYAGPTLTKRIGNLDFGAGYRFGYTKVDIDTPAVLAPGVPVGDAYDSSTNHVAWASLGQRPGDLPFGWQVSGGYEREDSNQLDQRFEGKYARADVTVPISPSVALLGGVGYEKVQISQRDPLLDTNGVPVRDSNGRFVTDTSQPRQLSFDTDGLIWDAGVMWRPSPRTSLTARVGRRYGDTVYTGSFAYRPDDRTLFQLGVYDGLSSFGRGLTTGLSALPTQFDPTRNPISGDVNACVFGQQSGGCLAPQLANTTTAQFRSSGVQAILSSRYGRWSYGVGAGYDRRKLLVPTGSVLGAINGTVDEAYYLFVSAGRQLDSSSDLSISGYLNYFDNGSPGASDVQSAGISAAYSRRFWRGLTGTAAAGLNAFDQDGFNSQLIGSALVGLRYNF